MFYWENNDWGAILQGLPVLSKTVCEAEAAVAMAGIGCWEVLREEQWLVLGGCQEGREEDGDIGGRANEPCSATALAFNLCKFSEITLQKQCQAEDTVALEEMIMDISSTQ